MGVWRVQKRLCVMKATVTLTCFSDELAVAVCMLLPALSFWWF